MPPPNGAPQPPTVAPLTFAQRIEVADYLTQKYKAPQQAYLWLSAVAAGLVLAMAAWMTFGLRDWKTGLPMLGASGVVSASLGRLLNTWNTISKILVEGKLP